MNYPVHDRTVGGQIPRENGTLLFLTLTVRRAFIYKSLGATSCTEEMATLTGFEPVLPP